MLSSSLRLLGPRGLSAVAATRGYSTIVGVPLAEQEEYFRKQAAAVVAAIPKGENIRDHWPLDAIIRKVVPGADDNLEVRTEWLDQDPKWFLENYVVDEKDMFWDPRKIRQEIISSFVDHSKEDPLPGLLAKSGVTGVDHLPDVPEEEEIDWDHFAKELEMDMTAFKDLHHELIQDSKVLDEKMRDEHLRTQARLIDVFAWAMADHQQAAKKILTEIEATHVKIQKVNQAGFDIETITYEDVCESNPDYVEELDIQLIEGKWSVDVEDLPKDVPVNGFDWDIDYPLRSREEMNDFWMEFNKRYEAAMFGGQV